MFYLCAVLLNKYAEVNKSILYDFETAQWVVINDTGQY